ncbi:MAG: hypothetical protein L6R40_002891 [Gallowayella cf. fulva]|nr:MAG: hypothetical protein L6R40_002891 [Xanthomendoza cf. fulva]
MPAPTTVPATSYPATTKQAAGYIDGILTDVMTTSFSDRIMVTITQNGRLAQWIHVPLDVFNPSATDQYLPPAAGEDSLLPMTHLTPKTLLGGAAQERETIGQLYAAQIASLIASKDPQEKRTVVLGLGLSKVEASREDFYNTIDLVRKCL